MKISNNPSSISSFLEGIGLKEKSANVYLALLKLGNGSVRSISRESHTERTTTYHLLLELQKLGLAASYKKANRIYFSVVSPERLHNLIEQRIEEQKHLQRTYTQVLPDLLNLFRSEKTATNIKQFEGIESLPSIYWSLYQDANHNDEGLEFTNWGGKYALFPQHAREEAYAYFKKNNVTVRSILVEDEITKTWKAQNLGGTLAKNIRLIQNPDWKFFVNMEMYQNKIALVTYRDSVHFQGVLIESPELSAMFRLFFETMWMTAK